MGIVDWVGYLDQKWVQNLSHFALFWVFEKATLVVSWLVGQ
jgi:hypothetical protein